MEHKLEDVVLAKNRNMAFLRVPSYEAIESLTMTATLAAATWSNNDMADQGWPTEHVVTVTKTLGPTCLDTNEHKTRVHTTRYRIELWPDPLTGEYEVLLPPVKWKIQQITADGYATLFQDGTTNEVIE